MNIDKIKFRREFKHVYKVIKLMRVSGRRQVIERGLTEAQAQRLVQRDIDTNGPNTRSMIIYEKQ